MHEHSEHDEMLQQRLRDACLKAGIRLTHQRLEVYREVASTTEHPDAESIHRSVRRRIPTISLDTVYRTLWLLQDLGLVKTLGASRERVRFDANVRPHHHFVCLACGRVEDFFDESLDSVRLPYSVGELGTVEQTHIEARGYCHSCSKQAGGLNSGLRSRGSVARREP
ncbi:transcriptional repressor [bacterium]|nr:transcriptional repressor [bacterium]